MSKPAPDYSLEREGVGLRDWLWRLLSEDRETRLAAGDVLHGMTMALPTGQTDPGELSVIPDIPGQIASFEDAVREIVNSPDFDTADFVRKLSAYRLALREEWLDRCALEEGLDRCALIEKRDERHGDRTERLEKRINRAESDRENEYAVSPLMQLAVVYATSSCEPGSDPLDGSESLSNAAFVSYQLMKILDEEFLAAPESIELLLRSDNGLRREAFDVLARIGPAAIEFASRLVCDLDQLRPKRADEYTSFDGPEALGSVGRGNAEVVEAMVNLLSHQELVVRAGAAETLRCMEADVCGRESEIVDLLLPMLGDSEVLYSAIRALASVGRHLTRVRQQVFDLTKSRPPRMRQYEDSPGYEYDEVMHERGATISALEYFTEYPDECVPVLTGAMETFEEYDPDYEYEGPLGRVSRVLEKLGPKAGAAAAPLASHLEDGDFPRSILEALTEMGPAAVDAVPALEAFRIRNADDDPLPDLTKEEVDEYEDPIGWTIQRIRGRV